MARSIWKGAISFGLVHIPVGLYPAASGSGVDFDWLDQRSLDPVGYKRVNKRTGKEVAREHIVKGVKVDGGDYVVLSEDEIRAAYPKTTQTIDLECFVQAAEVPFTQLDTPYYLEPLAKGGKVYALLREAMREAGVIGIARVVMHTKEHLAALVPSGAALVLNTLRWAGDIRDLGELKLPAEGARAAGLKDAELRMARQLIGDMTEAFEPERFEDGFAAAVHKLVAQRVAAGRTKTVAPLEAPAEPRASNVIDLTELLAQSLGRRKGTAASAKAVPKPARKAAARKTSRKTASRKTATAAARRRA